MVTLLFATLCAQSAWAEVPTQTLTNGLKMPLLSLGVFQYNESQAEESVKAAFQNGFNMVDCGEQYMNNKGVGRGLNALLSAGTVKRKDIWVQAKIDGCGFDVLHLKTCYKDTVAILAKQLTELGVDYVDSTILHFPPSVVMPQGGCLVGACELVEDQWLAMVEFYKANKTRAIGVSNYCKNCYECLEKSSKKFDVMPQIHQMQYHLGMGPDKYEYVSFAKEKGMAIQAYSTLANKPEWYVWEPRGINPQILSGNAFGGKLGEIARAHNASTIQVALKWIVQQGFTALTKSSNPSHLKQDSSLWMFDLTVNDMTTLNYEVPDWPKSGPDHGLHGMPAWACHPPGSVPGIVV